MALGTIGASDAMTSTDVAERIREARAARQALRIAGAGTWLDAGRRCDAAARLVLSDLQGVTRYEPGDFVLTAGAGTTLARIAEAAESHGQWLTLDPSGSDESTIGSVVATGSYGPLASAYGTPRDHVLGCEFVSGVGDVIRAGGQVVKNVAGFDLVRLVTGAWGTLGAITEVTVRMRARPEVDRTLAVAMSDQPGAVVSSWLAASDFRPLATELVSPACARALGLGGDVVALVRLGGNEPLVRAAADDVRTLGSVTEPGSDVWARLRTLHAGARYTVRVSGLPSSIAVVWKMVAQAVDSRGGFATFTAGRGVMRLALPDVDADMTAWLLRIEGTVVGERLPDVSWAMLAEARPESGLQQRIRRAFDPDGVLNPGVLPS